MKVNFESKQQHTNGFQPISNKKKLHDIIIIIVRLQESPLQMKHQHVTDQ